jgi:OmpA-OmpF porin, OOP family
VVASKKIALLEAIQFENDEAVVRPESAAVLRDVAAVMTTHPEIARVRIEGHTDRNGNAAHNTQLSDRRAHAVKTWLVEKGGVAAHRLEARGYGPAVPVASNGNREGRAKNRRVEFHVVEGD